MSNYISSPQLESIMQAVKSAIDANKIGIDLTKFDNLIKDTIDLSTLNSGSYLTNADSCGMRLILSSNKKPIGISFSFFFSLYMTELYIGFVNGEGDLDSIPDHKIAAYGKQPGLSLAIRHKVIINTLLDQTVVTKAGFTPWHVMTIAKYAGFVTASSGSGDSGTDSCSCKTWKGTQTQYDAIASKDPDTIYYITES